MYKFENVYKSFKGKEVLKNINLNIDRGQIIALIGRNGSGKTTSLKIMSNLLLADKGKTYFNNQLISSDDNNLLQQISVFFDPERSLYWRLSGLENLKRIASLKGVDYQKEAAKIDALLTDFGMQKNKDDYIMNYSKGMKTKILLIACFIGQPQALLLDEPFAGLDYEAKNIAIQLFLDFAKKGGTVIITEHNLIDLQRICDKLYWFEQGEIILEGTAKEMLSNIAGEGVIEILSSDTEKLLPEINSLDLNLIAVQKKDDTIYILSQNMLADFDKIRNMGSKLILNLQLHAKSLEDLYLFSDLIKSNNEILRKS